MVQTSPSLHAKSRLRICKMVCEKKENTSHVHHPPPPVESREICDGSRGIDVDARIKAMLLRRVQLPSFPGGTFDAGQLHGVETTEREFPPNVALPPTLPAKLDGSRCGAPLARDHKPATKIAPSSGLDYYDENPYAQLYHGPEQFSYHDHNAHDRLSVKQNESSGEAYNPIATSSPVDYWRFGVRTEPSTEGLLTRTVIDTPIAITSEMKSSAIPTARLNKRRTDSIWDEVLDELDEIASFILPGMSILSFHRRREHRDARDPQRCDIHQDANIPDFSFTPTRYRYEGPLPEWPSREQKPNAFLEKMEKRIEWLRYREMF